jgi:hypothetical protein
VAESGVLLPESSPPPPHAPTTHPALSATATPSRERMELNEVVFMCRFPFIA